MSDQLPEPMVSTHTFLLQESFLSAHESPLLLDLKKSLCPPWSLNRNILPHRGRLTPASSPLAAPLSSICAEEIFEDPPSPECRNHVLKSGGDRDEGYSQSQNPGNPTVNHNASQVLLVLSPGSGSQSATLVSLPDRRACREGPSRQRDHVPSFCLPILQ